MLHYVERSFLDRISDQKCGLICYVKSRTDVTNAREKSVMVSAVAKHVPHAASILFL